jgi:DNA-binding response OmpR family regulator
MTTYATQDGYEVKGVFSAEDALDYLNKENVDLIVLDLMLGEMSGEDLIRIIRKKSDVYIIVVSAKAETDARLEALSIGADDYMVKPISMDELMLKIRNLSGRIKKISDRGTVHSFNDGALIVRPLSEEVVADGEKVVLTQNEYTLLSYLIEHAGMTLSRDSILDNCFSNEDVFDRVVDVHIKNLRHKLKDSKKTPRFIATVYGGGYRFVGEKDA